MLDYGLKTPNKWQFIEDAMLELKKSKKMKDFPELNKLVDNMISVAIQAKKDDIEAGVDPITEHWEQDFHPIIMFNYRKFKDDPPGMIAFLFNTSNAAAYCVRCRKLYNETGFYEEYIAGKCDHDYEMEY